MLLVGCGAMGTRHARIVAADPACELLCLDLHPERAAAVAERHGARAVTEAPRDLDLAVVATPTTTHLAVAGPLLERGVWCLVEKPLAHSLAAARALASDRCAVGQCERFNPAIRAAGALRPDRVDAVRVAPPDPRGHDVDVVLDLMIHDLDLLAGWLPDDPVVARAVGDRDAVEVELRWSTGSARLEASRVADRKERRIRCDGGGRVHELDLLRGKAWRDGEELAPADPRDALTCQWASFRDRARSGRADPDPGLRALTLAERIRQALG